ncbi:hypothetical protein POM88_050091 [Heracleum sosnowskyi]|uniref:Uncharacterized protein n=1 Tax=Heracleum sosnowskyi TaxID=360622 RepID=A0AAD8M025_9APIA|nr:hypothetical protein POM88_050091 [Heracleum sosnowskyi]
MEGASEVTILEQCEVRPPPDTVAVKSLPLNFFDLIWLTFHPLGRVMFFEFPHSTTHFVQNIVPKLKSSLALALQHFVLHWLGNYQHLRVLIKCNTDFRIRYVDGDSVSVTFGECRGDLGPYSGNHARDGNVLKPLVPRLPLGGTFVDSCGETCCVAPVFAVQVTVFPNRAICIGMTTNSHVVAAGRTMFNFVSAWASIAKQVNISDTKHDVVALKKIVSTKRPTLTHVSSFTVVCAYLWTCFAKMRATVWEELHNLEEAQNFGFAMDCRARLDPPLPASYFGNCLVHCLGVEKGRVMIEDDGLAAAAEVLGNTISLKANTKILRGEWCMGIAGSPKCRDSKTDLEVGVILPQNEMDVFATVFTQGLHCLQG